jgi:hypothetical protein
MKKLILAAVVAAGTSQATASHTTVFEGQTNMAANACLYGVLPCTAGGTIGFEFDWNDDGDGILQTSEFEEFRLMVDRAVFAQVPASELANINILALNVNTASFDFWWTGAISPHVTVTGYAADAELCQGSAAYLGDASCGPLSGVLATDVELLYIQCGPEWDKPCSHPSPVPIPGAAWLFGSALLGLAGIKRKK